MTREMPNLHKQALKYKNFKRLKHDGGRAWIKNAQTFESVRGTNRWLETRHEDAKSDPKDEQ
ncbi:MAG TPA: hypothetical protein VKA34_17440 [Balneolales bacterium]|nr:hypothetical protein [Balneolales bacterium]